VGEYADATQIKFTGTSMYKIVLEEISGDGILIDISDGSYTMREGYTIQSFTDATGAPGIMKCIVPATYILQVSALDFCEGTDGVQFALLGTESGVSYQLYNDATPVGSALSGTGSAATFSGAFNEGAYTARTVADDKYCAIAMSGTYRITETPLPSIAYLSGSTSQTVTQGNAITDITYATTNATGATYNGLPAGVGGTWSANTYTIAGIPTASGTFSYTVRPIHTNGCGASTSAVGTLAVNSAYPPCASTATLTYGDLVWSSRVQCAPATTPCSLTTSITDNVALEYINYDNRIFFTIACALADPNLCPSPWRLPTMAEWTSFIPSNTAWAPTGAISAATLSWDTRWYILSSDCTTNITHYNGSRAYCDGWTRAASQILCVREK
jgi:hypothetical protein